MNRICLSLGSNVGDRVQHLKNAAAEIHKELGLVAAQSSVYETEPWGNSRQENFLNQVILIESSLLADEVMYRILMIEEKMGRRRTVKWEPRIIDIDILFFNDEIISKENLRVPHPSLHDRKFVLTPLAELIPEYIHPVLKKSILALLSDVNDPLEVKKVSTQTA
ncbi:MAG: 2-amino-4-hydroxy-6-hydroxymethyldihydropteridine diphosphokinase [Bacteroidetes bacterium]|nr:2-amino-4-hydroxy-6-hydroxymethyldihydropteridine diphosphokinase [Bacteroidota bacterium]